jgi:hypothetical protein
MKQISHEKLYGIELLRVETGTGEHGGNEEHVSTLPTESVSSLCTYKWPESATEQNRLAILKLQGSLLPECVLLQQGRNSRHIYMLNTE